VRASKPLGLSVVPLVLLAACGDTTSTDSTVAVKPKITISSTTDPTSRLLSEIYGRALERAGFRVARKRAVDTPEALFASMTSGDVELAGMTSQALLSLVLAQSGSTEALPNATTLQAAAIVKALPPTLKIGAVSTAEDKDVIACATKFTDTSTIATLTDLGAKPGTATLAAPDGFATATPLGPAGLKDTYQIEFKSIVPTASDKILEVVTAGAADCGVARSADPGLSTGAFTVLQDDKALVPNDVILPLVTADAGAADVLSVLDITSTRLTTEQLRLLMLRLKVDGAPPEVVANEFVSNVGT
jgi:glycine betaine/choline ABC-type transport system substrate-binding protein